MLSTDIVAYVFNADIYCPPCVIEALISAGIASPGARGMAVEDALDQIAGANAIDRYAEATYDSGEFPKVVFAGDGPAICGGCGAAVVELDDDTDDEAVARDCEAARRAGREIGDATARVIASWYQGPDSPGVATLVSTGEIVSATLFRDELVNDYFAAAPAERRALDLLSSYLHVRVLAGRTSAVPGWSLLWVR